MQTEIQTHTDRSDSYIEREVQTESHVQIETERESSIEIHLQRCRWRSRDSYGLIYIYIMASSHMQQDSYRA